jgi:hypothetical protein
MTNLNVMDYLATSLVDDVDDDLDADMDEDMASDDVADDMTHNYMVVDLALAYVSTGPKKMMTSTHVIC